MAILSTLPPELDEAPEWLRQALVAPADEPAPDPPSAIQLINSEAGPLLLDAALVDHFLPRDLAPGITGSREDAEAQVASLGMLTSTSDGRGWTLSPETRRQIISAGLGHPELVRAVGRTSERFSDPVSRHLRSVVTGEPFELEKASAAELAARRIAVGLLQGTKGLALDPPDALDHAIELRRIVERFERMVGKEGGGHRFYGRERDVEAMRAYVGEIGATTLTAGVQRVWKHAVRTVAGRKALSVHGGGGVGKTTLLAHFVLEHIQAAINSFPFVYLDFDRTTISARAPAELLAEMCVQVTAQFPKLASRLADIRRQALESAALVDRTAEKADSAGLDRLCFAFRQAIDQELAPADRWVGGGLPFLLMFDTFELVQVTPGSPDELASFVQHFLSSGSDDSSLFAWPRLRLVISGRRPVQDFLGPTEAWLVDALDRGGSIELLLALAADRGCPLDGASAARLVDAVARSTLGPQKGVRPLRLHLVAKALQQKAGLSPKQIVDDLIEELDREGSELQMLLVDGILVRRILGHVSDHRVRDLSDPGLVVRYIDPEIIREVIAPATPAPPGAAQGGAGYPLGDGEEEEVFQAFRNQVTLIEDHGDYVRHIQDVRREMLPLIRARRPQLFSELHERAYHFFRQRRGDRRAAGEAIYHGLWLGAPVEELETLWQSEPPPDPRLDPEEFALQSDASAYVRARTGRAVRPQELPRLPAAARLNWLAGQVQTYLRSRRPEESLEWLDACPEAEQEFAAAPQLADSVVQLFARTGRWSTAHKVARLHLVERLGTAIAESRPIDRKTITLLRSLVRIEARSQRAADIPYLRQVLGRIEDRASRIDILLHLLARPEADVGHDEVVSRLAFELRGSRSRLEHGSRHLALLLVPDLCPGLLATHVAASDSLPREAEIFAQLLEIAQAMATSEERERLSKAAAGLGGRPEHAFDQLDELFRAHRSDIVLVAAESDPRVAPFLQMLRFSHFDWSGILAASLELAFRDFESELLRSHVANFAPKESQSAILSGKMSGRRTLAAVVRSGKLLELSRSFAGPEEHFLPERFSEVCAMLSSWHLRLQHPWVGGQG